MIEVRVPSLGESIQEVQVAAWLVQEGEWVQRDQNLVELESEKATQALPAPESGYLRSIKVAVGQFAKVGDLLASLEPGQQGSAPASAQSASKATASNGGAAPIVMPAADRLLHENKLQPSQVAATGPGGRLLKEDVLQHVQAQAKSAAVPSQPAPSAPASRPQPASPAAPNANSGLRDEEIRPMSMMRRTIANRLVEAQQTAALLTTFNEIDMQPVMELRSRYKDPFQEKHGVKLGFMSFFAKASVEALKRFPAINAEIRGNDVVYRHYHDIGVAIGGGKGLVVPVLRNVERMSFAEIERVIGQYAELAKNNNLKPSDLEGGTFTISNGGVYGSLLSTPIVNPPQSGILGLHSIQDRPVAREGQVVIRPMMYVALTYDHRIVDGREAVSFLRTIKEVLEEPARLFLEV
jgi:2-oxoglutarate dehydrogenase E2 component (dihydrolipoamide succinyltransferase)